MKINKPKEQTSYMSNGEALSNQKGGKYMDPPVQMKFNAPIQAAGLGGFLKAGKRFVRNLAGGKGLRESVKDVKKHNKATDETFYKVFKNSKKREAFREHCKSEYSTENFNAFEFLFRKNSLSASELQTFADRFVGSDAPQEINIGKDENEAVAKDLQSGNGASAETIELLQKAIKINLSDTYSRFIIS